MKSFPQASISKQTIPSRRKTNVDKAWVKQEYEELTNNLNEWDLAKRKAFARSCSVWQKNSVTFKERLL